VRWSRTFATAYRDIVYSVDQTSDHGFILCGVASGFGGGSGAILIRTDDVGTLLWSKVYWNVDEVSGTSAVQTLDGGFILCGSVSQPGTLIFTDGLLVKTDSAGNLSWAKGYEGIWQDWLNSVQQT